MSASQAASSTPSATSICYNCKETLTGSTRTLTVKENRYHLLCWRCEECNKLFYENDIVNDYYHKNDKSVCGECADKGSPCQGCSLLVSFREPHGKVITALGKRWHSTCFTCTNCQQPIKKLKYAKSRPELPFCEKCPTTITAEIASRLEAKQKELETKNSTLLPSFSASSLLATSETKASEENHDKVALAGSTYEDKSTSSEPSTSFSLSSNSTSASSASSGSSESTCHGCSGRIDGQALTIAEHDWHPECFKCSECFIPLSPTNFFTLGHQIVCSSCMVGTLL